MNFSTFSFMVWQDVICSELSSTSLENRVQSTFLFHFGFLSEDFWVATALFTLMYIGWWSDAPRHSPTPHSNLLAHLESASETSGELGDPVDESNLVGEPLFRIVMLNYVAHERMSSPRSSPLTLSSHTSLCPLKSPTTIPFVEMVSVLISVEKPTLPIGEI